MAQVSHQTVRLSRGKHASPVEGVCVMELASMLAGEPFGDSPDSVSPVIAAFLRTYNDGLADEPRQDLYAYASKAVGTTSSTRVEQDRASDCIAWAAEVNGALTLRFPVFAGGSSLRGCEAAGAYAARAALRGGAPVHARALALVDRLVARGEQVPKLDRSLEELAALP